MGKARSPSVHQNKTHPNTPANTSFKGNATAWPVPTNDFILLQHSASQIVPLINPTAVKKKKMIFFSSASLQLLHGDIILLDAKVQML